MTRINIEQVDTGLFYIDGFWGAEPEWFSAAEAEVLIRDLRQSSPYPMRLNHVDFSATEEI